MPSSEEPSDASYQDIVERYHAGSASRDELFSVLFDRYFTTLARFGRQMGLSSEESRDLAQDAFIRFYRYLDQVDESSSLRALLLTTYRNLVYNYVRARHKGKQSALEVPDDSLANVAVQGPSAEDVAIDKEQMARVRDALVAALTTEEAALVMSRLVEGRSDAEIAEILAVSPIAVRARLQRALQKLRRHLLERHGSAEDETLANK